MQTLNMKYLSPVSPGQVYADNKNKYSNNKSSMNNTMDGNNSEYDFINRNSYLPKNKSIMNNNLLRMMMDNSNNSNMTTYDDYHYSDNISLSQTSNNISLSQVSNNIPSPSFSQYQSVPQNPLTPHKYSNGIHHNRSNPYEYTINSGDYTFEEYLRESKIKRSRSDNASDHPMNNPINNSSSNNTIQHVDYYSSEYEKNKNNNNTINSHYPNTYNGYTSCNNKVSNHYSSATYNYNYEQIKNNYGENYNDMGKQKYNNYEYTKMKTISSDMNNLYRNMIHTMHQDPITVKKVIPDSYPMKYNNDYSRSNLEHDESKSKKQLMTASQWNNMYNTLGVNNTNSVPCNKEIQCGMIKKENNDNCVSYCQNQNSNQGKNQKQPYSPPYQNNNRKNDDDCHCCRMVNHESMTNGADVSSNSTKNGRNYTMEREEELFVFYINFLRKELYNNSIKKMNKKNEIKSTDTNSNAMDVENSMNNTNKGNIAYNNSTINNVNSIPSYNGRGGDNGSSNNSNNNGSSQSSFMTSQSDPYFSPPFSPLERGEEHNTNVKYCIHLILNNGKIESYIKLPNECILCHHTCHQETVVEDVAEIYSNRFCRNSLRSCKYCLEHECKKKCAEFARTHIMNEDIAIDLETVEDFMIRYNETEGSQSDSSTSLIESDVQTLSGGNTSDGSINTSMCSLSKKDEYPRRSRSTHSIKSQSSGKLTSDKRSESSATLAMDQSSTFYDDSRISKQSSSTVVAPSSEGYRSAGSRSIKCSELQHQRSMNESFLKNYNLYDGCNDTKTTHALKTPGDSVIDASEACKAKIEIYKNDSHISNTSASFEMDSKVGNISNSSTNSYQEAVANISTTAKNMAKVIENTSFESRKGYDKYDKHIDYKGDPKTAQRLHRAEESRRKLKEKIGYERKVLSFLEEHGGEVTDPEDIRELTDIFVKEFSFYGFILRFSMVFAIICAMFSEHSRHISYNVDSFISISKIVVFVIVKNITPITSCISALILYVRFIETMDYETAGDRYKIVRHFSEMVRDDEFGQCVDKILGEYLERVNSNESSTSHSTTPMEEDPKDLSNNNTTNNHNNHHNNETMELDDNNQNVKSQSQGQSSKNVLDELAHVQFKSRRFINSDLPIFPNSSMNERNRNVVIDSYLLFIICLIISHKYTIDTSEYNYKNKSWYFIYTFFLKDYKNPNMTLKQFNQYEFYILCVLQYNIHISMEEYNNFDVFVKRNCSSFGKDLSLYITTNVLEKLSKAMVHQEYYKKLNSNNYKNYIFNSVINNMEYKIRIFFEQVIAMVKRNTCEYNKKYKTELSR